MLGYCEKATLGHYDGFDLWFGVICIDYDRERQPRLWRRSKYHLRRSDGICFLKEKWHVTRGAQNVIFIICWLSYLTPT